MRETWDITHEGPAGRRTAVKPRTRDYMIANMEKTLLRIEELTGL